jgi:hypothetical protein
MQFTQTGVNGVIKGTSQTRKTLVKQKYGIDIDTMTSPKLAYAPLASVVFARLLYLIIPSTIPSTLEARASYWKRYYNSVLGAGTVDGYIKAANRHKEQIDKIRKDFKNG